MEALLESSCRTTEFEAENNNLFEDKKSAGENHKGHTAMEELCERIANNQ